jgi:SAM-dependent methyltransferase
MSAQLRMWLAGIRIGATAFRKEPVLGLKRLALPVSYWRTAEFAYAWRQLADLARPGARILDLGSPKDLALIFARYRGCEVVAVDILPEAIALSRRYAAAQGLDGSGPGKVKSEVQDGRRLPYPDAAFEAAFSVSVLEHIPDAGDTAAIRELVRVVKPGGVVVVTTPYDRAYRETFVEHDVYERKQTGSKPVFFERHYDDTTLKRRLLTPAAAKVKNLEYWGERSLPVEALLDRIGPLRSAVSPLEPLLSLSFLRRVDRNGRGRPMAAFFTLLKSRKTPR